MVQFLRLCTVVRMDHLSTTRFSSDAKAVQLPQMVFACEILTHGGFRMPMTAYRSDIHTLHLWEDFIQLPLPAWLIHMTHLGIFILPFSCVTTAIAKVVLYCPKTVK